MTAGSVLPVLTGTGGELVFLSLNVDPHRLEDLLEALAEVSFPINPQLYHKPLEVTVEFPAYSEGVKEVREILERHRFASAELHVAPAIA